MRKIGKQERRQLLPEGTAENPPEKFRVPRNGSQDIISSRICERLGKLEWKMLKPIASIVLSCLVLQVCKRLELFL